MIAYRNVEPADRKKHINQARKDVRFQNRVLVTIHEELERHIVQKLHIPYGMVWVDVSVRTQLPDVWESENLHISIRLATDDLYELEVFLSKLIQMEHPPCGNDAVMEAEIVDILFADGKVFGEIDSQTLRDSGNYFVINEWMRAAAQRLFAALPSRAENLWVELTTDEKVDEYLRLINPIVA
jgi:predicted nucleotide-binding protein (sugar kinase/HSP70/actin superfamily)